MDIIKTRLITDGLPPEVTSAREIEIVWSSFLGTRVTKRNKKSTVAKVCDCVGTALHLNFSVKALSKKVVQKF